MIKLLKAFYSVTPETEKKIDICHRMVLRMFDEDDTVKDVAVKTMEELWFLETPGHGQKTVDKSQLTAKVVVIMGVAAQFKDKQSPLEELLHKAMADKDMSSAMLLHQKYSEICETLIDGLVDASDLPGFVSRLLVRGRKLSLTSCRRSSTASEPFTCSQQRIRLSSLSHTHRPYSHT